MKDLTGSILKGYEIQERIGVGGFGAVYKARQSTVGREVAIKIILPGYANQPDFIRRFETEAQTIARLEHMHIVPLHDFWRDPEGAYIVMRWYRGGSLRDSLADGRGYALQAANLLLNQITSGLAVAHRSHVIHRDLKPGNILLDEDSNAYLADFGIAKDIGAAGNGEITEPDQIIGSPDYLAPEQARSEPVTPQTDIYSLGVVLYEVLTGEHPFPNLTGIERLFKHINEPLPMISNLDPTIQEAVNQVIQKATEKNPAHRYADVLEMAAAFRAAVSQRDDVSPSEVVSMFTQREQEILQLMIEGLTNREIAERLFVEHSTVKWYINQIYKKLGVRSRIQAIVRARELNFVIEVPSHEHPTKIGDLATSIIAALPTPENPYKGLHAFQTADEKDFFGREKLTQKLLNRMSENSKNNRFLAIVGPSGSGKSSLVKAGLIPALWRGEVSGSEKWFIVDMLPDDRPLDKLEVALTRVAADQAANLAEHLQRDANGLLRVADLILPEDGSELVIIIDQFEEVFTLLENEQKRLHFLNLLSTAVTSKRSRVRVVVTLRADFYDRPLMYPDFGELVRDRVETVLPLTAKELESAILNPAQRVGVKFEEGVAATIADEVSYQPGALPLLQYALTELFERRENRMLTQVAYQEIGGTVGALAKRAEEIYQEFTEEARETARQMFLRLVTLGEGVEDTRRRTSRSELAAITVNEDLLTDIIDVFAEYRLLSLDNDPATRVPTVEVAHEAILREWDRLRNWLNESRTDVRMQRQLANLAQEWRESNQDKSFLLRGSRLENFEGWIVDTGLAVTAQEREYLTASTTEHQHEVEAEHQRQLERETLQQRARRVLQGLVAVMTIAAVIGGMLAFLANDQRLQAVASRDAEAEAREEALRQASIGLAAIAEKELGGANPERGVLLALEALEYYPYTSQAAGALSLAIEEFRPLHVLDSTGVVSDVMTDAAWSPDGSRVAASTLPSPMTVVIWDVATGNNLLSFDKHNDLCEELNEDLPLVIRVSWSPAGDRIGTVGQSGISKVDCGLFVFDTSSGETLLALSGYESTASSLDWSPDGAMILTGHNDGTAIVWDSRTGARYLTLSGHVLAVRDAVWSPDGNRIATASDDGTVVLWDAKSGTELMRVSGHAGPVRSLDWSPDSTRLVTGGNDALPRIWDAINGEILFVLAGHTDDVVEVEWSPDGNRIATQSLDFTVKLWDASTGGLLTEIRNAGPHWNLQFGYAAFSPDGKQLLTGASRLLGQVHIWDISDSNLKLFGHSAGQEYGAWSPDGTMIATSGMDGSTRIWNATTGQPLQILNVFNRWSDWSPDSTRIAMPHARSLSVMDIRSGDELFISTPTGEGDTLQLMTMDWSPDGTKIAGAEFGFNTSLAVHIWDAETSELLLTLAEDTCSPTWAEWSPDSSKIATPCNWGSEAGADTPARIWDAATGELLMTLPSEYGWSYRARWSPDGKYLLVTYDEGVAQIWDVDTGKIILTYAGHVGRVWTGAWSPDGTLIATTDVNSRQVKVWNSATGQEIVSFSIPGNAITIEWSPDGTQIIITGDGFNEPIIKRVFASPEELIAYAYECCITRELV